jgi:hypothetical protein
MTTQPYAPPRIEPVTLGSQTRIVHEARRRLAVARGLLRMTQAELQEPDSATPEQLTHLEELLDDAELAVLQEEDTLRALAVAAFHATGLSAVSPGITVEEHVVRNEAPLDAYYLYLVPRVTLADDLGAARDAYERGNSATQNIYGTPEYFEHLHKMDQSS